MTDLLLDTDLSPEQRVCVEIAHNSGDTVLVLIDDILDFSKIEAGNSRSTRGPIACATASRRLWTCWRRVPPKKGLDLAYTTDPQIPELISGDSVRLRQILVNLLGNAVKFTDRGGVLLDVGIGPAEDAEESRVLHFRVEDTGIGIPGHLLGKLFDAFRQVDDSDSRRHQGSGLGLAISRRLCELMGGKMWAESEPGRGSTFYFTLPLTIGRRERRRRSWPQHARR